MMPFYGRASPRVRLNLSLLRSVRRGLTILDHDAVEGPHRTGGGGPNRGANRKSEKKKRSAERKGRREKVRGAGERETRARKSEGERPAHRER